MIKEILEGKVEIKENSLTQSLGVEQYLVVGIGKEEKARIWDAATLKKFFKNNFILEDIADELMTAVKKNGVYAIYGDYFPDDNDDLDSLLIVDLEKIPFRSVNI